MAIVNVVEVRPNKKDPYVFTDLAKTFKDVLTRIGVQAKHVVDTLPSEGVNLILGWSPNWVETNTAKLPKQRTILYNAEQLGSESDIVKNDYVDTLLGYVVADYSFLNKETLVGYGKNPKEVVILPVVPTPSIKYKVAAATEGTHDIVFFGSANERRDKMLERLREEGMSAGHVGGFSQKLAPYIKAAKIVLHVHYYSTNMFPAIRFLQPLAYGIPIVCERSVLPRDQGWDESGIVFTDYEEIPAECKKLLDDPQRQRAIKAQYTKFLNSIDVETPWKDLLKKVKT